jgi:protein-tyrosine phosphatase
MQKAKQFWLSQGKEFNGNVNDKVESMASYCSHHDLDHVPDPYYGGGFDKVFAMLDEACTGLLTKLLQERR